MKRFKYHLYSGNYKKESRSFAYDFGNTKNIQITIAPTGYSITVERTVKHSLDEVLKDKLFRDAIKKVAKLQLILFGELSKADICISINDEVIAFEEKYIATDNQLIYCLCGDKLRNGFKCYWTDKAVQALLGSKKSKPTRKGSALDALILAKSKCYEAEKFVYLWMSMNGLYGFVAHEAKGHMTDEAKKWIDREYAQIKFFAMLNDLPYRRPHNNSDNDIVSEIYKLIDNIKETEILEAVAAIKANDGSNVYVRGIRDIFVRKEIPDEKMHPYAALLLFISYKIRCKYFHAENNLPLFSFENEHPIPTIRFLNELLEDYLDREIINWFDEEPLKRKELEIEAIASNCEVKDRKLKSCRVNGIELV